MGRPKLREMAVDTWPLRHSPPFRRLMVGQLISMVGRQVTVVALPYQVYLLTGSPLAVGMLGLAQAVPLLSMSLVGGAIADRVDRRRLLMVTQALLTLASLGLMVTALQPHPALAAIYAVVVLSAAVAAVDSPTRAAMVPQLVPADRLPGALAINMVLYTTSGMAGPAVGGLIISRLGIPAAYAFDAISFLGSFAAVAGLPRQQVVQQHREATLRAIARGFAFARHQPEILGGYAMDLCAMIFGLPRALFPVLAANTFHVGASGLGLLYSAPAAGAVLGGVTTGWVSRSSRHGRIIVGAIAVWGLAIAAFGLVSSLPLALLLLAIGGAADAVSAICRSTMMQRLTPDHLRGRLTSLYFMVVSGGPYLGDVEAGTVATAFGPAAAVVSGGLMCVAGLGLVAVAIPAVWRYRAPLASDGTAGLTGLMEEETPQLEEDESPQEEPETPAEEGEEYRGRDKTEADSFPASDPPPY
jgi:MFS family permease